MGRHLEKTCDLCCKRMRSDHLVRHMKTHEKKPNSIDQVTEYNSNVNVTALEDSMMNELNEYRRKLELGRQIKEIALKKDMPTVCLSKDKMEALELFENHGQVKEIEAVEWRPWQMDILKYVNEPTKRRIIWVVGEKGNEGKTFFNHKIEEQYGGLRVFQIGLIHSARDTLRIMKKYVYIETDIFLFDIPRSMRLSHKHYE